jgi:membrane protein YqaA with SNARE-associated domain
MHRLADFLQHLVDVIRPWAEQLGGPGLAAVAFLDSSFLSLPEVSDALIVLLVIQHPARWFYYAACTTVGSVAGCYALYMVGRKGGEAFLRKRFAQRHLDRGLALFRRHGMLAVIIPSILPPPMPFKIFVLLSGVAKVRTPTFLLAVALGRGIRYGVEAWLAYLYGAQAMVFIRENLPLISLLAGILVAVLGVAFVVWRKRARTT